MELEYSSSRVEKQCVSFPEAKKLFGGDELLARKLLSRIQLLKEAECLKDIICTPQCHFHNLDNRKNEHSKNYKGYYAIDIKSHADPWRLLLQPLDEHHEPYESCNIDEIADVVRAVKVEKVSNHYE